MSLEAQVAALQKTVEEQGELLRKLVDNVNALRNPLPQEAPPVIVEGADADPEVAKFKRRKANG